MKIRLGKTRIGVVATALALSFLAGPARAETTGPGNGQGLNEHTSAYIRDYLSDHRRAGSLAGSILGGALFAHPAGPILGSLVGFFVGKQSMFNEDKVRDQQSQALFARRSIVPQNGGGQDVPSLSFASTRGIKFDSAWASAAAPRALIPMATPANYSRAQIAAKCSGGRALIDPRLRSLCFYLQGGAPDNHGITLDFPPAVSAVDAALASSPAVSLGATPRTSDALESEAEAGFMRERIAAECGGKRTLTDPRLRSLCFYQQESVPDEQKLSSPARSAARP